MRPKTIQRDVRNAVREVRSSPLPERIARAGIAAKGLVYVTIGILAGLAAFGNGGETTDSRGAIGRLANLPFGQLLLAFLAVGLVGYSLWRFVQGIADTDHKGSDAKGWAKRAGAVGSGIVYFGLAIFAAKILIGAGAENGNQMRDSTSWLMRQPFGAWLVGLAGLIGIGAGVFQMHRGYREKFRKRLRLGQMNADGQKWAIATGKWGYIARGVVFCIVGLFLIIAGLRHDPNEARGLEGALDALAQQAYGPYLLGAMALGLLAYGAYMFFEARYRKIEI